MFNYSLICVLFYVQVELEVVEFVMCNMYVYVGKWINY